VVNQHQAVYLDARPASQAEDAARIANQARSEIEALRALTPPEAVQRITQTRAAEQAARQAAARAYEERRRQVASRSLSRDGGPHASGPIMGR